MTLGEIALTPGQKAQLACLIEATARKPGNVHPSASFADAHYFDFLLSASALVGPMDRAAAIGIGAAVLESVRATRRIVAHNTNLGMILLLAPLAACGSTSGERLRSAIEATTIDDARAVYQAIRLAQPGGLGQAETQDVRDEPTITLFEAMRLAADRDLIARQYADGYADVLNVAAPALRQGIEEGRPLETAILMAFLKVLADGPETLIARKRGRAEAEIAMRLAQDVWKTGWPDSREGEARLRDLDRWLRAEGHGRNPGSAADVTASAIYVALDRGWIAWPWPGGPSSWEDRTLPSA